MDVQCYKSSHGVVSHPQKENSSVLHEWDLYSRSKSRWMLPWKKLERSHNEESSLPCSISLVEMLALLGSILPFSVLFTSAEKLMNRGLIPWNWFRCKTWHITDFRFTKTRISFCVRFIYFMEHDSKVKNDQNNG